MTTPQSSTYVRGLLITTLGVLIISPDGLFTRLIDTDPWTFAFWRGLLSGSAICLGLFMIHRRQGLNHIRKMGWAGLCIVVTFAFGGTMFVYAFTTTPIANTLFIVSTQPVFAALIGWYFLNDSLPRRTIITIGVVLIGIAIIAFSDGAGVGNAWGNLAALAAALSSATGFSLARRFRNIDMVPAVGLAGFVTAVFNYPLANPLSLTGEQWPYLLFLGLCILPISFTLLYIGPRYIPAAEVALITLLEALLGPLLVWWMLGESPGVYTWFGGAIILSALVINAAIPLISQLETDTQPAPS